MEEKKEKLVLNLNAHAVIELFDEEDTEGVLKRYQDDWRFSYVVLTQDGNIQVKRTIPKNEHSN